MKHVRFQRLRIIHGSLHEMFLKLRRKRYYALPYGQKFFIIGTPEHTNLGDSAIAVAQESFLRSCGFWSNRIKEITFSEYKNAPSFYQQYASNKTTIFQLGGGNMGNQWFNEEAFRRQVIDDFPKNQMMIFPQTIFYTPTEEGAAEERASISYYNRKQNLTLVAREKTSLQIMKKLYPDTQILLTPDIVLSANIDTFGAHPQKRSGVLLCMRNDAERSLNSDDLHQIEAFLTSSGLSYHITDMHSNIPVTKENRKDCVRRKMEEFLKAELVITDRLHGMVFAAITGTPCVVFSNYNHKVLGTYEWISYLPYIKYANSLDEMKNFTPSLLQQKNCAYDNTPLLPYFEKLAEVVKEKCRK